MARIFRRSLYQRTESREEPLTIEQPWRKTWKADPRAAAIADRHYSRQKPGTAQFAPPARHVLALIMPDESALWVSTWPDFARHAWAGMWNNTLFRNEGHQLSSTLIRHAVAATLAAWGRPPERGMVTFVAVDKVRPKKDPGRCYLAAGFEPDGYTVVNKHLALVLTPDRMPHPSEAAPVAYYPRRLLK